MLLSTYGKDTWTGPEQLGVYRSNDRGKSWQFASRLKGTIGALDEPAITRAADGQIVMVARPNGELAFSDNDGRSWSKPIPTGIKMVAPCLLTLKDGTVVCLYGYGSTGGLQIIFSDDHGTHGPPRPATGGSLLTARSMSTPSGLNWPTGQSTSFTTTPAENSKRRPFGG
ncbi:MAG: hypothetical protein Ct9H300mP1_02560 [Planctomycetaceae bacterium]|nr:MAG: hypothetical protein Ct9H300mP1_02560 [Planctomycetaceae bacterium]